MARTSYMPHPAHPDRVLRRNNTNGFLPLVYRHDGEWRCQRLGIAARAFTGATPREAFTRWEAAQRPDWMPRSSNEVVEDEVIAPCLHHPV